MPQYIKLPVDTVGLWPKRLTAFHRHPHHHHTTSPPRSSSQTNNTPQQQPSTPPPSSDQQKMTSAPWRTRPDFQPQQQLLGIQDIDLDTALLPDTDNNNTNQTSRITTPKPTTTTTNSINNSKKKKNNISRPMSESQRQAIRQGRKDSGPMSPEHRQRISQAMREAHAKNPDLRKSNYGVPKKCSYCGELGHNRRKCPQLLSDDDGSRKEGGSSGTNSSSAQLKSTTDSTPLIPPPIITPPPPPLPPLPIIKPLIIKKPPLLRTDAISPLPTTPQQCCQQAASAILRAWSSSSNSKDPQDPQSQIRRQRIEILLPQSQGGSGWPGGIRQQFRVGLPMIEDLLKQLKQRESLEGRITAEWLDETDCVAAWQSEKLTAVLFPTGDTVPDLQRLDDALSGTRLVLAVNTQWQARGQVISDFGVGAKRRKAEEFVDSFEETYHLSRVGVFGDDIRVLRAYPGPWQVYYYLGSREGKPVLLACDKVKPTYQRLLELVKTIPGSRAGKNWLDRALTAGSFDTVGSYDDGGSVDDDDNGDGNGNGVVKDIVTGEVID